MKKIVLQGTLGHLQVDSAVQKERDAAEMQLDIWEFEAGPLQFYEALGYRTLKRHLVVNLSQEVSACSITTSMEKRNTAE